MKKFAIKQIGDSLNSGPSVFETDDDIELVGDALPFSLKFVETLLAEVPDDPDLEEIRAKRRMHDEAYFRWGREALGWALWAFRAP